MNAAGVCIRCRLRLARRVNVPVHVPRRRLNTNAFETLLDEAPRDEASPHALNASIARERPSRASRARPTPSSPYRISRPAWVPSAATSGAKSGLFLSWDNLPESQRPDQDGHIYQDLHQRFLEARGKSEYGRLWDTEINSITNKPDDVKRRDAACALLAMSREWLILVKADGSASDTATLPSPTKLLQDLDGRVDNALELVAIYVSSLAQHFLRLLSLHMAVLGTNLRKRLLNDIFAFWDVCNQRGMNAQRPPPRQTGALLPEKHVFEAEDTPTLEDHLHQFVYQPKDGGLYIVDTAVALWTALRSMKANSPHKIAQYQVFFDDMNSIIKNSVISRDMAQATVRSLVRQRMPQAYAEALIRKLAVNAKSETTSSSTFVKSSLDYDDLADLVDAFDKSLARFRERQDLDRPEQLWSTFSRKIATLSDIEKQDPATYKIYEEFLLTFRSLRRADYTALVWNSMIGNGLVPTTRTWNVMLKGCHIGREVDTMEKLWTRMNAAGVEPNVISWGIRVHGLFRFNKIADGFVALSELGRLGQASSRSNPKPALATKTSKARASAFDRSGDGEEADEQLKARPTVKIWNSALSGAAHIGSSVIGKILEWGRTHNLTPDIVTYNVLINVALADCDRLRAKQIIDSMKARGVQPDSSTFVVLLHSMLSDSFLGGLSHEQQEAQAMAFVQGLERDGVAVDTRSYALLIDRLLKLHNNAPAATAVLRHMTSRGVTPTPHVYTILATHYFDRQPSPDLAAVEALWANITSRPNYLLDVIFYDRMVEGYARVGDLQRVMYFLTRMANEGKRPGWLALTAVLGCMLDRGERERAKELLRDVRLTGGYVRSGVRGRAGEEWFWDLVQKAELQ